MKIKAHRSFIAYIDESGRKVFERGVSYDIPNSKIDAQWIAKGWIEEVEEIEPVVVIEKPKKKRKK